MYRVGVEWILGLKLRDGRLHIDPCIPNHWEGFDMVYRYKSSIYRIRVDNPERVNRGVRKLWLDDVEVEDKSIMLTDKELEHKIRVILGTA